VGGDRFALALPYAVIGDRAMDKDDGPAPPLFLICKLSIIDADLLYLRCFSVSQCAPGKRKNSCSYCHYKASHSTLPKEA